MSPEGAASANPEKRDLKTSRFWNGPIREFVKNEVKDRHFRRDVLMALKEAEEVLRHTSMLSRFQKDNPFVAEVNRLRQLKKVVEDLEDGKVPENLTLLKKLDLFVWGSRIGNKGKNYDVLDLTSREVDEAYIREMLAHVEAAIHSAGPSNVAYEVRRGSSDFHGIDLAKAEEARAKRESKKGPRRKNKSEVKAIDLDATRPEHQRPQNLAPVHQGEEDVVLSANAHHVEREDRTQGDNVVSIERPNLTEAQRQRVLREVLPEQYFDERAARAYRGYEQMFETRPLLALDAAEKAYNETLIKYFYGNEVSQEKLYEAIFDFFRARYETSELEDREKSELYARIRDHFQETLLYNGFLQTIDDEYREEEVHVKVPRAETKKPSKKRKTVGKPVNPEKDSRMKFWRAVLIYIGAFATLGGELYVGRQMLADALESYKMSHTSPMDEDSGLTVRPAPGSHEVNPESGVLPKSDSDNYHFSGDEYSAAAYERRVAQNLSMPVRGLAPPDAPMPERTNNENIGDPEETEPIS